MIAESRPASLAKTTPPSVAGVVDRARLFATLDRRDRSAVLWVCGPPGSGKTTLVASYVANRRPASRWYQLDGGDSDVATFFYYMGHAPEGHPSGVREAGQLPLFTSEYHGDLSAFARRYFQTLYASLKPPFVLVLDNYQDLAPESDFHGVLADAAAELPPDGCIMVISRGEPPPAMARLRANRALQTLGWNDLKLSREESDAIVARWGVELSPAVLARLYEKTQGWAAGLVLLLDQSLGNGELADTLDLSAPQAVFDYLAGEIFQKFDAPTRELLLRTAFMPEIDADTAQELSGAEDAEATLCELHRAHHFVTLRPGGAGHVYQYHPMLKEFLRARAASTYSPAQARALRRASATLLEAQGKVDDALGLLREDGDWEALERLVLEHAAGMLSHGRAETLEQWLEELPDERLESEPWCYYWKAACRFLTAPRASRLLYERAFELFEARPGESTEGLLVSCAGAMEAILYELDDLSLLDRWIARARGLLALVEDGAGASREAEARVTVSLFIALVFRQPQSTDMKTWAERALERFRTLSDINARMTAQLLIAITLNYTGRFDRARELVDDMRRICRSPDVTPLALTVLKDVESMYGMLTADHERCLKAVYDGVEIGRAAGVHIWTYHLLSNGAAGALGAGDLESAEELLREMHEQRHGARRLDLAIYHHYKGWRAMLRDDLMAAYQEEKTALRLATETGCPFYEVLCRLALAQILFELGEQRRAATQLRRVRSVARHIDNRLLEFMCLAVYAHIALRHGRERSGLNALRYAFGLGREFGFRHFLWWNPRTMAELCARALEAGVEVDYARSLVRVRGLTPAQPPVCVEQWPWRFRVRSFGEFEVLKDDRPLGAFANPQQKPIELLKALVGFGGERVQEALLAESLWPRIDGDYAHRSLTTTLHRLRKLLGEEGAVVLKHGRLTLDPRRWWLDLRAFEAVARDVDAALDGETAPVSREDLAALGERLLAIYRGPFMASEGDHPRYVPLRERLRNRFLRYVGELGRRWEEMGEWDAAVALYRRSLEADPLAEGLYRRLMLCFCHLGRPAEAVEVYDVCRRTFLAELGAEPSPETAAIRESAAGELAAMPVVTAPAAPRRGASDRPR